jgi:hypothetical protein
MVIQVLNSLPSTPFRLALQFTVQAMSAVIVIDDALLYRFANLAKSVRRRSQKSTTSWACSARSAPVRLQHASGRTQIGMPSLA